MTAQFVGSQFSGPFSGPLPFTTSIFGYIPPFSAGAPFGTDTGLMIVPGSSVMIPIASAPPAHLGHGGIAPSPAFSLAPNC